jgi:aryl-alcohol dehydrogenase-like predicted oxidoreductase
MEYRRLGSSGLQVSALSLGAWVTYGGQVGVDTAYECMTAAYDAGVNFFDNAEVYDSENRLEALRFNRFYKIILGWKWSKRSGAIP